MDFTVKKQCKSVDTCRDNFNKINYCNLQYSLFLPDPETQILAVLNSLQSASILLLFSGYGSNSRTLHSKALALTLIDNKINQTTTNSQSSF